MSTFDTLFATLLQHEGGYVDNPADRGGPTKYGITQRTLTNYLCRETSADDVKAMTKQMAREIYHFHYWIKPRINELPPLLQPIMFDMAVNMGNYAITLLQTALDNNGFDCGKIDGKIGEKTLAAARQACDEQGNNFLRKLVNRRVIYYENLVKHNESQREFLAGWIKRAESFMPEAVA